MSSQRKAIRNGIKTYLNGKTVAGTRIFTNRTTSLWKTNLPLMLIYTRDESAEVHNVAPREYKRVMTVMIEGVLEANDLTDDALDDFGDEIEVALFNNDLLTVADVNLVSDSKLIGTELFTSSEGEKTIGVIRQTWELDYYTEAPDATVEPSTPLEGVDVDWQHQPFNPDAPETEDIIELDQS